MSPVVGARAAALSLVVAVAACADPPPSTDEPATAAMVDAIMAPAFGRDALGDPARCVGGVAVVVTPTGALVRGYGATVAGGAAAPDAATLFQIGSISKVITGLALARQVDAGALTATTPALAIGGADLRAAMPGATFTLADLVSHHAGFPTMPANLIDRDGDGVRDPAADPLSPARGYARADLLRAVAALPLAGAAPYAYSNLGLGLLGLVLQDHLALPDNHALLTTTLAPLAPTATWGTVAAIPANARDRVAQGYALGGGARITGGLAEMGVLAGAGEVTTTGADMALLLAALTGQATTPLAPAVELALTPIATGGQPDVELGYAIEIRREAGGTRYTKGGATPSYTAYLSFHRAPPVGALVLTSCGGFDAARALALALDDGLVTAAAP
ncbi:MAG: serine hydrolase [Myxococcales bacterium]|nr:serine hydrolase [Myxococcales bacterium]